MIECQLKVDILRTCMELPLSDRKITREQVVARYGEQAALAWDDYRAARRSYYREAERHLKQREANLEESV